MAGYLPSHVVVHSILAALDHVTTLKSVIDGGMLTVAGPWTLVRGIIEPAALAVWLQAPLARDERRQRALRVWHHDLLERGKWETDSGIPDGVGPRGKNIPAKIIRIGEALGLDAKKISAPLSYSGVVGSAGKVIGRDSQDTVARWRECSGFAHGSVWPRLQLAEPISAERVPGGLELRIHMDEPAFRLTLELAADLLDDCLERWAAGAATP